MANIPLLMIPMPVQISIHMAKSNIFQFTSGSTRTTIARWQKGEYYNWLASISGFNAARSNVRASIFVTASFKRARHNSTTISSLNVTSGRDARARICLCLLIFTLEDLATSPTFDKTLNFILNILSNITSIQFFWHLYILFKSINHCIFRQKQINIILELLVFENQNSQKYPIS